MVTSALPIIRRIESTKTRMRKKILLVDDDDSVVSYLAAKLSQRYDVVCTVQPRVAVAMARAERPDLILCDIDMPGMSGGEVAAALAADAKTAAIPLIYLTALVSPAEARELQGLVSGRPAVAKRARMAELIERIEHTVNAVQPPTAEPAGW